jgi:hypothetical protein
VASFDVFTVVAVDSIQHTAYKLAEFAARSMSKLKSKNNSINFLCVTKKGMSSPNGWNKIGEVGINKSKSENLVVSDGYDLCLKRMRSDFVVFCHLDISVLCRNWDSIVVDLLNTYQMVGVPHFNGGFNSPSQIFCCASRDVWITLNISFKPILVGRGKNIFSKRITSEESTIIGGSKPGSLVKFDTGHEIPFKMNELGYKSYVFPATGTNMFFDREGLDSKKSTQKKVVAEWSYKNKPFLGHFQGGRHNDNRSDKWIYRVGKYLEKI